MAETSDAVLDIPAEDIAIGGSAELEYAGFWSRVAALIVDNAVVTIFGLALLIAAAAVGEGAVLLANFVYILIALLYWPVMESSGRQATLGKQLLGLQVTDQNGARLSFVRALLRNLAKIISWLPFGLGFVLAAFTARKQALHDLITKCLVVRAGPSNFMRAVLLTVGALVIAIAGGYYYVTEVYLPQTAQERVPAKPATPPAPAAQPAPTATAPGSPKPMTTQEIAELEKKLAQAKPEPAKVAAATSPAPPAAAKPEQKPDTPAPAKPATAELKPGPAQAAKEAASKPEPKPASAAVASPPKPKPVPVEEAPADAEQKPTASAPSPERAAAPRKPAEPSVLAYAPLSGRVRSPRFNDVMTAVMYRDAGAVSELLELGWWVDRPDSNGVTPLMAAAWNGDVAMTQLLLKAGANPSRHTAGGSVLDYAGRGGDAQIIQLLRSSGAR